MKNRLLVLEQTESDVEFDIKFKEMFGLTFTDWQKTARCHADEDIIEYEDGVIFAGMTAYDISGYKIYT
jgi:hypothetical protein